MSEKKFNLRIHMLLCVTLFCACGEEEENQYIVPEWEDACKEMVRNMESDSADPYVFRQESDRADSDFCVGYIGHTILMIFITIAVFWGSLVYVSDYKITKTDTSVSPDGTYELVLQAVGEADFPFGSASGRLVLYEGKSRISKADFELFDDGKSIHSSIWEVTWHEDSVEVILFGDEQFDEQIILYFDGKKEIKQLTDKDLHNCFMGYILSGQLK